MVAEELHFGRAAERLGMGQSPLSQQIRQLEGELGVVLIERGQRVVGLTDAGHTFLGVARALLSDLDHGARLTRRASRGEVGTILVGYVIEVTTDVLPLSLKAYREHFPDIEIELVAGTTGELLDGLRRHRLDVTFVRDPRPVDDLEYEQLLMESLFAALPSGHPMAGEHRRLAELADEAFVVPTYQAAQGLRRDIDAACAVAGFTPTVAREISPLTAVLLLVAAGAGVALLPAGVARSYPAPGVEFATLDGPPTTTIGMAWRHGESSQITTNFLDVTRHVARDKAGQPDVWPERRVEQPHMPVDETDDGGGARD
jgi:DNA-binding transcriptional LysR family regulator